AAGRDAGRARGGGGEAGGVEQQDPAPLARDRRAREGGGLLEERPQALDDDLLLPSQLVHRHRQRSAAGPQQDHRDPLPRRDRGPPEQLVEADQGHGPVLPPPRPPPPPPPHPPPPPPPPH